MRHNTRTAVLLIIILAVISGLYVWNRLSHPASQLDQPEEIPFGGIVPAEITHGDTSKKQIIFTFDAGSGDISAVPILAALKRHGVKGTFFMTGEWALRNPDLVRAIAADGHEIFNHSYNHPYMTQIADNEIVSQLITTDEAISSITGSTTRPYFRPPYGDRDARVLAQAAHSGFRSVYWTIDAMDWQESSGESGDSVSYRILNNLQPGMIILMHIGDSITGTILDSLFTEIEHRGYSIVSLTQGL